MEKEIANIPIGNGDEFIAVEIDFSPLEKNRVENVSRIGEDVKKSMAVAKQTIYDSMENIKKLGESMVSKLKSIKDSPSEIGIELGLKFTVEAGVVIANAGGETHVNISIKWKKDKTTNE